MCSDMTDDLTYRSIIVKFTATVANSQEKSTNWDTTSVHRIITNWLANQSCVLASRNAGKRPIYYKAVPIAHARGPNFFTLNNSFVRSKIRWHFLWQWRITALSTVLLESLLAEMSRANSGGYLQILPISIQVKCWARLADDRQREPPKRHLRPIWRDLRKELTVMMRSDNTNI